MEGISILDNILNKGKNTINFLTLGYQFKSKILLLIDRYQLPNETRSLMIQLFLRLLREKKKSKNSTQAAFSAVSQTLLSVEFQASFQLCVLQTAADLEQLVAGRCQLRLAITTVNLPVESLSYSE